MSRASQGKGTELMGPPPAPGAASTAMQDVKTDGENSEDALSQKILGPEVKTLRECLINSATITAQLVNHHTDVHKVGVQRHAPYPPRVLRESWLRQAELYDEIIDSMEIQLRRALAAVEYQIEQEQEKLKTRQEAEAMQKSGSTSATKGRKQSLFIDIPRFSEVDIDPSTVHPEININKLTQGDNGDITMQDGTTLTEEPDSIMEGTQEEGASKLVPSGAVVPKDSGLMRSSRSSISLTSLNRHGLKLDLSSLAMDSLADQKSSIGPRPSGLEPSMPSPVTLAPKSARPRPDFDGDFPIGLENIASLLQNANDLNIEDLLADEIRFPDNNANSSVGDAASINQFLSTQNLLPVIKMEEQPISLLGSTGMPESTAAPDQFFEQLGLVEDNNPTVSSASGVNSTDQLSLRVDGGIGPFGADFNLMDSLQSDPGGSMARMQQQRQQFGLDLNLPPGLSVGGGTGYQLLGDPTAATSGTGDTSNLADFNFNDLFGSAGDGNSASAGDGTLDFSMFNDPPASDSKSG